MTEVNITTIDIGNITSVDYTNTMIIDGWEYGMDMAMGYLYTPITAMLVTSCILLILRKIEPRLQKENEKMLVDLLIHACVVGMFGISLWLFVLNYVSPWKA